MIFPECFHGPLITLWRATCGPLSCSWTTLTWPTMTLFHQQQWRQIVTWVLQYNIRDCCHCSHCNLIDNLGGTWCKLTNKTISSFSPFWKNFDIVVSFNNESGKSCKRFWYSSNDKENIISHFFSEYTWKHKTLSSNLNQITLLTLARFGI